MTRRNRGRDTYRTRIYNVEHPVGREHGGRLVTLFDWQDFVDEVARAERRPRVEVIMNRRLGGIDASMHKRLIRVGTDRSIHNTVIACHELAHCWARPHEPGHGLGWRGRYLDLVDRHVGHDAALALRDGFVRVGVPLPKRWRPDAETVKAARAAYHDQLPTRMIRAGVYRVRGFDDRFTVERIGDRRWWRVTDSAGERRTTHHESRGGALRALARDLQPEQGGPR